MDRHQTARRILLREALFALLVVALTFLNFGHVSVSASGDLRVTPDSWCGSPLLPDSPLHSPCHACRIGNGADLPPAPACIEPVVFVVVPAIYRAPVSLPETSFIPGSAQPRGPPVLI